MIASRVFFLDGSGRITPRRRDTLSRIFALRLRCEGISCLWKRGRGPSDLCRVPPAKRGVGRRPLRKALEVIEARCSNDISSPPRCRRSAPPTPAIAEIRSLRSRIEGEERLRFLPFARIAGCVDRVAVYVPVSVCMCNKCVRERLHRVSIGSPVAHPARLFLRNYVISRISLSPNRLRI